MGASRSLQPCGARVAHPSIETIDLGVAILGRDDITARGYVIHEMLRVLGGQRRFFVLGQGNPYIAAALYGGDPEGAYDALCRAVGVQIGAGVANGAGERRGELDQPADGAGRP